MSVEEPPGLCYEIYWPAHTPDFGAGRVTAAQEDFLWTGHDGGQIVQWTLGPSVVESLPNDCLGHSGSPVPSLVLCSHTAPINILLPLPDAEEGPMLLSVSADGQACVWAANGGRCIRRAQLPFAPGRAATLLPGGRHVCISHATDSPGRPGRGREGAGEPCFGAPGLETAGVAGGGGFEREAQIGNVEHDADAAAAEFHLAIIDVTTLAVASVALPTSMHSLARYFGGGPDVGPHSGADLLALGAAPVTRDGHAPVILGVARQGSLLTWDVPKTLLGPILQGRAQAVGRHPAAVSPKTPTRPITPHTLSGALMSAGFGPDGQTLLLVCGSGWLLLESDERGFEGGPRHLVPCAWGSRQEAAATAWGSRSEAGGTGMLPVHLHRRPPVGDPPAEGMFSKGAELERTSTGSWEEGAMRRPEMETAPGSRGEGVGARAEAVTATGSWEEGAGRRGGVETARGSRGEGGGHRAEPVTATGSWVEAGGAATRACGLRDGGEGAPQGREHNCNYYGLEQLQGGALILMGSLQTGQVSLGVARPDVVIWDGRGAAALLHVTPTGNVSVTGVTLPVTSHHMRDNPHTGNVGVTGVTPPVTSHHMRDTPHAPVVRRVPQTPGVTIETLAFIPSPPGAARQAAIRRVSAVSDPGGVSDIAITCFTWDPGDGGSPGFGPTNGVRGQGGFEAGVGLGPRETLREIGESRLSDVWRVCARPGASLGNAGAAGGEEEMGAKLGNAGAAGGEEEMGAKLGIAGAARGEEEMGTGGGAQRSSLDVRGERERAAWGESRPPGRVTVTIVAGGDALAPTWLVQGFSSGSLHISPLATASVLHPAAYMAGALHWLHAHRAPICCLLEHRAVPDQDAVLPATAVDVLISAAVDGSVCGWDISGTPPTAPLFSLDLHTAPVTHLLALTYDGEQTWGNCFASASEDGSVCITSLAPGYGSRSLPGYPGCIPARLVWVPALGYLACLFRPRPGGPATSADPEPVAVVWDFHSGKQDRVVAGAAGQALMDHFATLASAGSASATPALHRYIHTAAPRPHLPPGAALLEVDVTGLIQMRPADNPSPARAPRSGAPAPGAGPAPGGGTPALGPSRAPLGGGSAPAGSPGGSPRRRGEAAAAAAAVIRKSAGRGGEAAALAMALAVLHVWGLDNVADQQVVRMAESLGLIRGAWPADMGRGQPAADVARGQGPVAALPWSGTLGLMQGALAADRSWTTLQLPNLIFRQADIGNGALPAAQTLAHSSPNPAVPCADLGNSAAQTPARSPPNRMRGDFPVPWQYGLFRGSREFGACRTLAMVALAKRLMGRGPVTEQLGNGCSLLVALYAVRLREALPHLAVPQLELFASLWQDPRDSVRDAARSVLAAATDPSTYGVHGPVPFEHLLLLFRRGIHPAHVSAAQMLDPANGEGEWGMPAVLAAGAACAFHPRAMPDQLLALVVPKLAEAAVAAPAPHSAVATAILADGLAGTAAARWRPLLGDISVLLQRILQLCEQLGSGVAHSTAGQQSGGPDFARATASWHRSATMQAPPTAAAAAQPLPPPAASARAAEPPSADAARALTRSATAPARPRAAAGGAPAVAEGTPTSGRPPGTAAVAGRNEAAAAPSPLQRSPSTAETRAAIGAAVSRPGPQSAGLQADVNDSAELQANSNGKRRAPGRSRSAKAQLREVAAWRDGVAHLLPSLALADLPLFLHLLGHRLAGGSAPESPSHVMLVEAVLALAQSRTGQAALLPHLPLLASVLLKGLDPSNLPLRRTCLQVVTVAVKELCVRFPMVAYSSSPLQLAVGRAPLPGGQDSLGGSRGDAAVVEPIAVYDLETGQKKRALHFRADGPTDAESVNDAVSAVAFNAAGDALAAFTAEGSVLRVWPLVAGWTQRLQRSAAVLLPSKVLEVDIEVTPRGRSRLLGGPDLGWSLRWESPAAITVLHNTRAVLVNL